MAKCRLKLYGKRATQDDILEEIYRLLYTKGERPYPIRPTEIAKVLGVCRQTVYSYIKKLSKKEEYDAIVTYKKEGMSEKISA